MSISTAPRTAPAPVQRPVLPPLQIGPMSITSPVVLAPMAGITNRAFRRLCAQYGRQGHSAGGASGATSLYVSEMITSRALVERTPITMRLVEFDADEDPRSIQLYGVDPATVGAAARDIVANDRADHIDLNFGCPVPKVTRKGGGAALPWKASLFGDIVSAAVQAARPAGIPVTVKMRIGIDDAHHTHLEAGRIAEDAGAAAVALHARTADQAYSGQARWEEIRRLKQTVRTIPVLGNGDIWSAEDAVAMVEQTGCDGVVVGRGCLGRPWLFTDLAAAFAGSDERVRPDLREVTQTLRLHAQHLAEFHHDEGKGCRDIRKHITWYLKGFRVGGDLRSRLGLVDSLAALDDLIATLDLDQPWPDDADGPRGRAGSRRDVALPEGWLDSQEVNAAWAAKLRQAEESVDGG